MEAAMTRSRQALIGLLVAIAGLLGGTFAAPVAQAHKSCSHGWVRFYEDANLAGDSIAFCADDPGLENNTHTPAGLCNGPVIITDSWNNCISSFTIIDLDPGHCFQMYNNNNYTSTIGPRYWGQLTNASYNLTGLWNDSVSSFRFGTTDATC